jgi:hypothetical protein
VVADDHRALRFQLTQRALYLLGVDVCRIERGAHFCNETCFSGLAVEQIDNDVPGLGGVTGIADMNCGHALVLLQFSQSEKSLPFAGWSKMIAGSKIWLATRIALPVAKTIKEQTTW